MQSRSYKVQLENGGSIYEISENYYSRQIRNHQVIKILQEKMQHLFWVCILLCSWHLITRNFKNKFTAAQYEWNFRNTLPNYTLELVRLVASCLSLSVNKVKRRPFRNANCTSFTVLYLRNEGWCILFIFNGYLST